MKYTIEEVFRRKFVDLALEEEANKSRKEDMQQQQNLSKEANFQTEIQIWSVKKLKNFEAVQKTVLWKVGFRGNENTAVDWQNK